MCQTICDLYLTDGPGSPCDPASPSVPSRPGSPAGPGGPIAPSFPGSPCNPMETCLAYLVQLLCITCNRRNGLYFMFILQYLPNLDINQEINCCWLLNNCWECYRPYITMANNISPGVAICCAFVFLFSFRSYKDCVNVELLTGPPLGPTIPWRPANPWIPWGPGSPGMPSLPGAP